MTFWSPVRIEILPLPGIVMVRISPTSSLVTLPNGHGQEKPMPGAHGPRIAAEGGDDAALLRADPPDAGEQNPEREEGDQAVEPIGAAVAREPPPKRSRLFAQDSSNGPGPPGPPPPPRRGLRRRGPQGLRGPSPPEPSSPPPPGPQARPDCR